MDELPPKPVSFKYHDMALCLWHAHLLGTVGRSAGNDQDFCNTEERLREGIGGYKGWSVPWEASGPVVLNSVHVLASPSGRLDPHPETPVLLDSGTAWVVVVLLLLPPHTSFSSSFL